MSMKRSWTPSSFRGKNMAKRVAFAPSKRRFTPGRAPLARSRAADFTPSSQMRQAAGSETKALDTNGVTVSPIPIIAATANAGSNAMFVCLNATQEGVGLWNRVGRRIRMKSIQIKGHVVPIVPDGTKYPSPSTCRIILFYDRQPNKALPDLNDVLLSYNSAGGATTTAFSGLNMNNRDRFLMLRDSQMELPPAVGTASDTSGAIFSSCDSLAGNPQGSRNINWFVKLKGSVTHYLATANPATIGEITEGSLILGVFDEVGDVAHPAWTFEYQARLKFLE